MKDADGAQETEGLPEVKRVPCYTGERAGKVKIVQNEYLNGKYQRTSKG